MKLVDVKDEACVKVLLFPFRKQTPPSTRRSLSLRNQRRRKLGRKRSVVPALMMTRRTRKVILLRRGMDNRKETRR